jgi:hypothetical protein
MGKKLGAFLSILAALAALAGCGSQKCKADPDDITTIVQQQDALGQTPGEIAEELHQGDPRISWGQAANEVWEGLQDRG